jgi:hypothetical protein
MPTATPITKATLQEIRWDKAGSPELKDADGNETEAIAVQFNPQTLKVNYANQKAGGDQSKGSAVQFVGKGTTKLTCELIFDVTVLETGKGVPAVDDVRALTAQVNRFMEPKRVKGKGKEPNFVPPGVRFDWGTFQFDGVMDSVDETIDFFSEDGVPLRATVGVSISKQEIKFDSSRAMESSPFQTSAQKPAGITPLKAATSGDTLAKLAGPDYKSVAAANGIENPRMLAPGTLLDLSGGLGLSASLGLSGGAEASIGASFGISAGTGASFSVGASAGAGASASAGADAGLSADASASVDAGFR